MRADAVAARMGADESVTGADAVARWINGRAAGAVPATVGGEPGAAWAVNGKVRVAFGFTVSGDGRITAGPDRGPGRAAGAGDRAGRVAPMPPVPPCATHDTDNV